ncbi:hypothetical protein RV03_GL003494 [Enterococcus gallinarum]|nr:hypothetical protein RV03_GL003494 [Enterococcus gallinarum]
MEGKKMIGFLFHCGWGLLKLLFFFAVILWWNYFSIIALIERNGGRKWEGSFLQVFGMC